MKYAATVCISLVVVLLAGRACGQEGGEKAPPELETFPEKAGYSLGLELGRMIQEMDADMDTDMLVRGLQDVLTGRKPAMSEEEAMTVRRAFDARMREKAAKERTEQAKKNLEAGRTFLAQNKGKEGVVTTETGLQYKVLTEGDGKSPKPTDTVRVHYRGKLLDGTEFDSSYKRGRPAFFPVNRIIPGLSEALQLMKVGSKWKCFVPARLAYGERGSGQIGPNAVLVFELRLIKIEPGEKPAPGLEPEG